MNGLRFAILLGLVAPALTGGCGGKTISMGGNPPGSTSPGGSTVAPSTISAPTQCCSADGSMQHPNVCCTAGPGQNSVCTKLDQHFGACPSGTTTYPDPSLCCVLDHPSDCYVQDQNQGVALACNPIPGPGYECVYACPPGQYSPQPGECCESFGPSSPGGPSGGECSSSSSVCGYNPSNPQPCPPQPQGAYCNIPCPSGWQAPSGEPDLCCQTESDGTIDCFSQATGAAGSQPPSTGPYPAGDAGPVYDGGVFDASLPDAGPADVTTDSGPVGTGFCGGTVDGGTCDCGEDYGGHSYQMNCNDLPPPPDAGPGGYCVCLVDGTQTGDFTTAPVSCNDSAQIRLNWTNGCGFPGM